MRIDGFKWTHGSGRAATRREFLAAGCLATGGMLLPSAPAAPVRDGEAMPIIPRSEWANGDVRLERLRQAGAWTRLTVHHTGGEVCRETDRNAVIYRLDGIRVGHVNRHCGDIGYHFLVDYAGRVWEGRSMRYEGAHVSAANSGNIGIALIGNFERQYASGEQLASVDRLILRLQHLHGINRDHVYGHRDLGHSLCPGKNLYAYLDKWRRPMKETA